LNLPNIDSPTAENVTEHSNAPASANKRLIGCCIYLGILCGAFALYLRELAAFAAHSQVHSYILLIPLVTAYLIYIRWKHLSRELSSSWGYALLSAAAGTGALLASQYFVDLGQNDYMTLIALSFFCFVIAGTFLFLGSKWALSAMFPVFFLAFMIPLPEAAVDLLENASKEASAEVANWLFLISGTPFLRNGFRVLVISLLCVHIGPDMINSVIHRRGGPVFFTLSLVPLFAMLWLFRQQELKRQDETARSASIAPPMQAG